MKAKTITLSIALAVALPILLCAQQQFVHFEYDAAGNRIERYLSATKLTEADTLLFGDIASYDIIQDEESENEPAGREHDIEVYPNPTYGLLNIDLGQPPQNALSWHLYDQTGRIVLQDVLLQQSSTISLQDLQAGAYLLYLPGNRGFKIIKQ